MKNEKFFSITDEELKAYSTEITMQFVEPTPDIIITSKLNVNYTKPTSDTNLVVDKFFNDICCNNHELVILLYCIIGCACCATNKFHKTFVFYGKGGNGKGTFFDIVKEIVGDPAGSMSLKQLSNDKFAPAYILGKTVNICDDERITNKIDTEIIKSLFAEGWVNGQVKYGHPFDFKPVATFLIVQILQLILMILQMQLKEDLLLFL